MSNSSASIRLEGVPFNSLTPSEDERLAILIGEASEVINEATKIQRHGYFSYHPAQPAVSNRMRLANEIGQLEFIISQMKLYADINSFDVATARADKSVEINKWLHHNEF